MKGAILYKAGDLRYEDTSIPCLRKGWALIKVKAVGLCGSDIPRLFETGTYSFPLIPGHEFSGEVVEINYVTGRRNIKKGDRVTVFPLIPCKKCRFCKGGFFAQCNQYDYLGSRRNGAMAEYVEVPIDNIFILPEEVDFIEASLTEPASVALHALNKAQDIRGKTMALFGSGTIGLILSQIARFKGVKRLFLIDIDDEKLRKAQELGFKGIINSKDRDVVKTILKMSGDQGIEIVVEGVGLTATYNQAIEITAKLGNIIFLGNPLEDVMLKKDVVSKILRGEITIQGTWNSVAFSPRKSEWMEVLRYMAQGRVKTSLLAKTFPLKDINGVLDKVREGREKGKVIFLP